jgi:hypothetical protein
MALPTYVGLIDFQNPNITNTRHALIIGNKKILEKLYEQEIYNTY